MSSTIKNFNLFVDGKGYAGSVEEFTPPALALKLEDFRAGGMDGMTSVDMGMEKMEASFVMSEFNKDILNNFGLIEGGKIPLTLRAAQQNEQDGSVTPIVYKMRGKIVKKDGGTFKAGEKSQLSVTVDLDYYKLEHGGETLHEIDVINTIRIVNGHDQLASIRSAIGL